jgi:hypothetical protein
MGKQCKPDVNAEAVRQVNELTDSEQPNGEDLLESEKLKRLLREAKQREQNRAVEKRQT